MAKSLADFLPNVMRRLLLIGLFAGFELYATEPRLVSIIPLGGQIGTDVDVRFEGERLNDTQEIVCYEPGLSVSAITETTSKVVKARIKIDLHVSLGEHHLRLRTASGFSELMTFFTGPFPVVQEAEPNNDLSTPQLVSLNTTVEGILTNEDVDCFAVEVKKDQVISAEVEGIRTGRSNLDTRLMVYDPHGHKIADVDDTVLTLQDPYITFTSAEDGRYSFQLREVAYGGSDKGNYRLHIGTFLRPSAVFPLGGAPGDRIAFSFYSPVTGFFTNSLTLPNYERDRFAVFSTFEGRSTPTPNWVRVSAMTNIFASGQNTNRDSATDADCAIPVALNGILNQPGEAQWFRLKLQKGQNVEFNVFARRLRSPVDSMLEVFDLKGQPIGANDDSAGADSTLRINARTSTNYLVKISDRMGRGGPDYGYRIEVVAPLSSITVRIPEVARNDTQSRQFITIPRGNRFATLIAAKRSNVTGPIHMTLPGLPAGITMVADDMPKGVDAIPVVFEASPDAAISGQLLDLMATCADSGNPVIGHFKQQADLVLGPPNQAVYYSTTVGQLAVGVANEVPFKLRIVEPAVPLVESGSMRLEVVAERATNFDEPIDVSMVWNPPGVTSQSEATIQKGATNVFYQLNAGASAQARIWHIAVLGHSQVGGGKVYASSQMSPFEVAPPYLRGLVEKATMHPGGSARMTVDLQQSVPFDGKAKIRLMGLPEHVTADEMEITKNDETVVFNLKADAKCSPGVQKNLFCAVDVPVNGHIVPHAIANGGILRILPEKKTESKLARAEVAN
jgi:hypothetical protein